MNDTTLIASQLYHHIDLPLEMEQLHYICEVEDLARKLAST